MPFAVLVDGRTVEFLPRMIGTGAMKEAYSTADPGRVICFYKNQKTHLNRTRRQRLELQIEKRDLVMSRANADAAGAHPDGWSTLSCWPVGIITEPKLGYLAPVYPFQFYFTSGPAFLRGAIKDSMRFIGPRNRKVLASHSRQGVRKLA